MMDLGSGSLGIDEAGRGPLIGPLVVCGFFANGPEERRRLLEFPLADSKALSAKKREALAKVLADFQHEFVVISPSQIDQNNINTLEIEAISGLIRRFNPRVAVVDAMAPPEGIPKLACHLRYLAGWTEQKPLPYLILENKADATYPICMAASILAKVKRDEMIGQLREHFGDFGSGYPSDPKTRNFVTALGGNFGALEPHLRKKWATLKRISNPEGVLPAA